MMKRLLATVVALLIGAASASGRGYAFSSNLPFGALPGQVLDIYTPTTVTDDTPVLVYLFGGGFVTGSKGQARVIDSFLARGLAQ